MQNSKSWARRFEKNDIRKTQIVRKKNLKNEKANCKKSKDENAICESDLKKLKLIFKCNQKKRQRKLLKGS